MRDNLTTYSLQLLYSEDTIFQVQKFQVSLRLKLETTVQICGREHLHKQGRNTRSLQRNAYWLQYKQINTQNEQVEQAIRENALPKLLLAQAQNQAAAYAAQYEQNEKQVNTIYFDLQTAPHDTSRAHNPQEEPFSRSQKASLRSIAMQCPYLGGNAVFAARAMLAAYDNTYYDDKALCLEQGILWRTTKPNKDTKVKENNWFVKIYPNPTNDKVNIAFRGKHTDGFITLHDMYGRILIQQKFNANEQNQVLDTNGVSSGVYILRIDSNEGSHITEKISILK